MPLFAWPLLTFTLLKTRLSAVTSVSSDSCLKQARVGSDQRSSKSAGAVARSRNTDRDNPSYWVRQVGNMQSGLLAPALPDNPGDVRGPRSPQRTQTLPVPRTLPGGAQRLCFYVSFRALPFFQFIHKTLATYPPQRTRIVKKTKRIL